MFALQTTVFIFSVAVEGISSQFKFKTGPFSDTIFNPLTDPFIFSFKIYCYWECISNKAFLVISESIFATQSNPLIKSCP